jgi:hypothetical protein
VLGGTNTVTVPNSDIDDHTMNYTGTTLGHERLGSDLSIAVDPHNANRLFVAYAQVVGGSSQIIVQVSTDAGATWAAVPALGVAANTALPALAVADNGAVGMLYTEFDAAHNLETRFIQATANLSSSMDTLVTYFPDNTPAKGRVQGHWS